MLVFHAIDCKGYPEIMRYLRQLTPEMRFHIGADVVLVNPLLDDPSLNLAENSSAYVDRDRRYRVSAYALVVRPEQVAKELVQLGRGQWSADRVVHAVQAAHDHFAAHFGVRRHIVPPISNDNVASDPSRYSIENLVPREPPRVQILPRGRTTGSGNIVQIFNRR